MELIAGSGLYNLEGSLQIYSSPPLPTPQGPLKLAGYNLSSNILKLWGYLSELLLSYGGQNGFPVICVEFSGQRHGNLPNIFCSELDLTL